MIIQLNRWDRLESAWSSAADGVIVVIEEMAERLRNKGISQSNMIVLPNTIHRAHFDTFGINQSLSDSVESDLTLVYPGGMDGHRGRDTAIRAMPTILTSVPTARLILVGDGAARRELEERCNQLALGDSVQFLGWQPQETIPSYIAGDDIGLIPYIKTEQWDHTIPRKLFHYMRLGLPVVASNCKPIERILQDSDSGLIHLSGDPEDLARAVISLAENPGIGSEKGKTDEEVSPPGITGK